MAKCTRAFGNRFNLATIRVRATHGIAAIAAALAAACGGGGDSPAPPPENVNNLAARAVQVLSATPIIGYPMDISATIASTLAKDDVSVTLYAIGKDVDERTETIHDTVRRTGVDVQDNRTTGRKDVTARGDYDRFRSDFQSDYGSRYKDSGYAYDDYEPAYHFGRSLREDARFENRDWNTLENDVRADWERLRPGTWERFKEAIRYSWDRMR